MKLRRAAFILLHFMYPTFGVPFWYATTLYSKFSEWRPVLVPIPSVMTFPGGHHPASPCVPKIWAQPTQTLCPRKPPTQTILEHKSPTAYLPPLFIDILSTHGNCQSAQRRHVLRFYTCNKLYILLLLYCYYFMPAFLLCRNVHRRKIIPRTGYCLCG